MGWVTTTNAVNSATQAALVVAKIAAAATGTAPSSATTTMVKVATINVAVALLGPFGTVRCITQREGLHVVYKALTAVYTGIAPNAGIHFFSFEHYRDVVDGWHGWYTNNHRTLTTTAPLLPPLTITFLVGLLASFNKALAIIMPAEVSKIHM